MESNSVRCVNDEECCWDDTGLKYLVHALNELHLKYSSAAFIKLKYFTSKVDELSEAKLEIHEVLKTSPAKSRHILWRRSEQ